MSTAQQRWEAAYRNAEYWVRPDSAGSRWVLRVGASDPAADRALQLCGVRSHWALVTACNPRSEAAAAADNAGHARALLAEIESQNLRWLPAVNRDPARRWPDEPGVLLIDPPAGLAERLGRQFRQNAILAGTLGGAPALIWLEPAMH